MIHITKIYDGGRSTSGHPKERADCTVRSLACARGIPYDKAYHALFMAGRRKNKGPHGYNGVMCRHSGSRRCKRSGSLGKFVEANPVGRFIVHIRGHALALVDGTVYDTHESSPRCHVIGAWPIPPF